MKLFNFRKNKSLTSKIKDGEYSSIEIREMLHTMPIHDLRAIGKAIVYSDYDGYNDSSKRSEMYYFDNLDRWQKEIYVDQRLYKIL